MGPNDFLPFASPDIGEEEIEAVINTMRSGWLTTGPVTDAFEKGFLGFLGSEDLHAVAVNSATVGLHLAFEAIDLGPGDEVIVPTWTFTATAEAARYLGANPRFVDVDPQTLCLDLAQVEAAITERTKAIVPVHFAGRGVPEPELSALARKYGLPVIEDAAHSLPTVSDGKLIGTHGHEATVFSFYATKTLTTGEGGILITPDADIAKRVRTMRMHGINRDVFDRYTTARRRSWYYEVVAPGFKYNMTDLAASIGRVQLGRLYEMRDRRAKIVEMFCEGFAGLPLELPTDVSAGDMHAWHLFVAKVTAEARVSRDEFIDKMMDAGIGCSVHFIPLHKQPYWRDTYRLRDEMFPVASSIFPTVVSFPLYSKMTDSDVDRVLATTHKILAPRTEAAVLSARQISQAAATSTEEGPQVHPTTYLSPPDITKAEEEGILAAIRSGWVAPLGPCVDGFEQDLAAYNDREHCVALSSGTAALHLGLLGIGVRPDQVVITSSMTFAATANAAVYTGATPVFIDADKTGSMDPQLLEEAITDLESKGLSIGAIMPVDLLGKVVDHHRIGEIAARHGIPVLADAAESLGARLDGVPSAKYGVAAVLSFNGNKIMTTSGGGALLTDDGELAKRVRYLSTQARQPVIHYEHTEVGYNYRMSNLLAGLGRVQLSRLDSMLERRRHVRHLYRDFFADVEGVSLFGQPDENADASTRDNFWLTSILIDSSVTGWTTTELMGALLQHRIESRPLWKPMHLQPVFANNLAYVNGTSERLFATGLSLPSGSALSNAQLDRVLEKISDFLEARR